MVLLGDISIGVIGLGYVGLPLAVEFGKYFPVVGFDIDEKRIEELLLGQDRTKEVDEKDLAGSRLLNFSKNARDLGAVNFFIITVPTPIDKFNKPDLSHLISASELVGNHLKRGDIVVYESTVYPGATEEDCVPVLERISGLRFNVDFFCGYSPERINPGDKDRRLSGIVKVVSGSTPEVLEIIDSTYQKIVRAGTYKAPSIKIAEAAKVIENTQRDINIALVNELSMIFERMGLDTQSVIDAASTKWNFQKFMPGLVGGHCIGVDPYYLTHKAQLLGMTPQVILAGRRVNDGMGAYVASRLVKFLSRKSIPLQNARVLILGVTFKENCPDLRNTKVVDIYHELESFGLVPDVYDPTVDSSELERQYGFRVQESLPEKTYQAIVLAVGHDYFKEMGLESLKRPLVDNGVFFDLKLGFQGADIRL